VNVQGQKSDKLDLSVGLKVLANALSAFGASVPSLDFAFQRARKVVFTFTDVTSSSVAPLEAGNFLAGGDLNTQNPVVRHYFLDDADGGDAQAYLIFDVLKSNSITVSAVSDSGASVKLDVPQIQAAVGVNVGVTTADHSDSTLTFKGQAAVTFGFKALEINFVNGSWALEGAQASGALAFAAAAGGAGAAAPQPVLLRSGFVRL
jgi:hypothetical protein